MKWIGQHIYDIASRFRNDVYLEDVSTSTETDMLVVDSAGKITKRAIDAITVDVSDFMTNGVNNRVLTATGTDAMNAEANLTFDGETLGLIGGTTTNIIDINARALTTGSAIYIDCDSLGNSPTIHLDVDDAQTDTHSRILHWIDYDKSSNTPNTIANSVTGSAVYLNDNAESNHAGSTHILTGHDSQIGVLNANGTQVLTGHSSTITNGTAFLIPDGIRSYFSGITDGYGVDFQSVSSANTADYFTIDTTTNGATTLTTVDADAALAHFEIAADGDITLDAAGQIKLEPVAGNNILLDGTIAIDAGVITGATSITSTAFVGDVSGGAWTGTAIAQAYIANDAINGDKIADDAIDSEHYTDGSIDTAHIADDQVTFAKAVGVTPNVFDNTIKLLPSDFMSNEEGGATKNIQFVDNDASGIKRGSADGELLAFVSIPQGMSIDKVDVYAGGTFAVDVIEMNVNASNGDLSGSSIGTGNCNTQVECTNTASTATNYFMIQVDTTSTGHRVYGGIVTIV